MASTIQLSLATALPTYRPGETITALLLASTSLPEDIELQVVDVQFTGIERVDTSWVSPAYRKDIPTINNDRRRVQRHVLHTALQAATQGTFADSNIRRFLIRFTLPPWLPPTFKGTAVRYSYYLEAKLSYFQFDESSNASTRSASTDGLPLTTTSTNTTAPSQPPSQPQAPQQSISFVTTRLPIHIWPWDAPTATMTTTSSATATGLTKAPSSFPSSPTAASAQYPPFAPLSPTDPYPSTLSDDCHIKCWELGHGTAVEDAISHISKLNLSHNQLPTTPFSPGLLRARQAAAAGGGGGGGGGLGFVGASLPLSRKESVRGSAGGDASETASEISSYDDAGAEKTRISGSRHSLASIDGGAGAGLGGGAEKGGQGAGAVSIEAGGVAGQTKSYALRMNDAPLVTVCVHAPSSGPLQPGSIVSGTLEFSSPSPSSTTTTTTNDDGGDYENEGGTTATTTTTLRCLQVHVMLETEELVDSRWRLQSKKGGAAALHHAAALRKVLEEHMEVSADAACTNFVFSIPRDVAPTFHTPLVSLRWLLRFSFVAVSARGGGKTEQLSWVLPLAVLPPQKMY